MTIKFLAWPIMFHPIFNVEKMLDIVDAQMGFTAKIPAMAELRLQGDLVTHLFVGYSGSASEMDYMNARTVGFKQSLLEKK